MTRHLAGMKDATPIFDTFEPEPGVAYALSMRQPWLWAVLHAGKRIENRKQRRRRVPRVFYLHEALGMTRDEYTDACAWMHSRGLAIAPAAVSSALWRFASISAPPSAIVIPRFEACTRRGGIVARVECVGLLERNGLGVPVWSRVPDFNRITLESGRWHMKDEQFGFVLDNVRAGPFVKCPGSLGFFKLPKDVAAALQD